MRDHGRPTARNFMVEFQGALYDPDIHRHRHPQDACFVMQWKALSELYSIYSGIVCAICPMHGATELRCSYSQRRHLVLGGAVVEINTSLLAVGCWFRLPQRYACVGSVTVLRFSPVVPESWMSSQETGRFMGLITVAVSKGLL